MLSLAALACWIGGLILLASHPMVGAGIAAAGFVFAGKAVYRKDDMAFMFGALFLLVLLAQAFRLGKWLLG